MIGTFLSSKSFWLVSRTAFAIYARFPLLGSLNAAIGVMRCENTFLVIERNDGRGVSFPGGLQRLRESPEQALVREVREETGLKVTGFTLKHRYHSSAEIPVNIAVFEIEAQGNLQESWEGMPRWLPLADLRRRILESQRPVLELFE